MRDVIIMYAQMFGGLVDEEQGRGQADSPPRGSPLVDVDEDGSNYGRGAARILGRFSQSLKNLKNPLMEQSINEEKSSRNEEKSSRSSYGQSINEEKSSRSILRPADMHARHSDASVDFHAVDIEVESAVGPGRCCSPRHRMTFHSRNEGSKRVLMAWRAMFAWGLADIAGHVIECHLTQGRGVENAFR